MGSQSWAAARKGNSTVNYTQDLTNIN